jgi:hypothetical protein
MKVIESTLALVPTASELFNDRLVPAQDAGSDGLAADDALIGDEPAKLLVAGSRVITDFAEAVASREQIPVEFTYNLRA